MSGGRAPAWSRGGGDGVSFLAWLARWIPARPVGFLLGWLALSLLRVRRRVVLTNMEQALGLRGAPARALAATLYRHLGRGALELLRAPGLTQGAARELMGEEGMRRLEAVAGQGKGMLVLTAHLGHWDLLACAAARAGLPLSIVTRRIKSAWLDRFWSGLRGTCGVKLLPDQGSAGRVISRLRRGEVVGYVLDQHQPGGLAVPFFGRPAATSTSLARLARATGSPVVAAFLIRQPGGGYRLEVSDPLPAISDLVGSQEEKIQQATRIYTETLEQAIRRWPEQWLWLHRRWKI